MSGWLRDRLTYANVVATLCLFLLLGGTAIAAKAYLITSTQQIAPRVLKQLHGSRGPRGRRGARGAQGKQGAGGETGPTGPAGPAAAGGLGGLGEESKGRITALVVGYGAFEPVASEATFTVSEKSKVLVKAGFEAVIRCETEPGEGCKFQPELQVDGNRIGSIRPNFNSEVRTEGGIPLSRFESTQATVTVGPGTHTVQFLAPIAEPGTVEAEEPSLSVIAIGQ